MLIISNIYYITFLIYNFFISFFSFIFSIKKDNLSIRNIIHYNKNHQIVGVYYDLWVAYTTLNNTDDYCEIFYYYNNSIYIIIVKNRENIIKYPPEGAYSDNNKILSLLNINLPSIKFISCDIYDYLILFIIYLSTLKLNSLIFFIYIINYHRYFIYRK